MSAKTTSTKLPAGLWLLVSGKETRPPASQAEEQAKLHFEDFQDDPIKIWITLESTHVQQLPAPRFNTWDDFFTIRKRPDESLSTLIARIEEGMAKIQKLHPQDSSKPYSLSDLDAELVSMAMICALGKDYVQFASSLILLKSLDKKELKAAFLAEETHCKCGANAICDFCKKAGHCVHKCFAMQRAREVHKTRQPSPGSNALSNVSSSVPASANMSSTVQNLDADVDWNADTGATSYMTPHRHYIRNYTLKCMPIQLANSTIVYSAGVESVVFNPVSVGQVKSLRVVEFT
ncbi:uncharacterized protein HD556DRAFT_1434626 [Suillus plorans]|uniref:Uncharacterized protein n=1 Tax=Suillus plorans TaxID=116603 RepID=A0A9P7ACP7_9AGAM|nr:uncharacterized protein HD556DRAFT_1434626 [Suillus plorans]KAG1786729.1 hypothetical protein HD556DRAFT_1434626 [Suillus plorans]